MKFHILLIGLLISVISCKKPEKKESIQRQVQTLEEEGYFIKVEEINSLWKKSDFDSAVAVILNGNRRIMYDMTQMDTNYAFSSRKRLNNIQLKNLTDELSGRKKVGFNPSDCFKPFHGVLFYKKGEIVGRLAICFVCSDYITLPREKGGINLQSIKQTFLDLGLPVYNWDDSLETAQSKVKYKDF